jgi:transcriptional regulator with XRE-family HTH domain
MRFGEYLANALEEAGYTQRSFAAKVKHHQANFNQILLGKRSPPLKHIQRWADLLQGHIDPLQFRELALLENSPIEIQKLVNELREKVRKAESKR